MRLPPIALTALLALGPLALGCGGNEAPAPAPAPAPGMPAPAPAPGVPAPAPITPAAPAAPQTQSGALAPGDETLQTGEFADAFPVTVTAGQSVTVEANTNGQLDPYLILRAPSGQQVENDDYNGSTQQSRVEHIAAESGQYTVLVTSYEPGQQGPYTVTINVR